MAVQGIGPLRKADEGLNHQLPDTFGTVADADYSWTEKIWMSMARMDGTMQVDFGLGKYHNRNVFDGFAGVSRGKEQWTVRASRELATAPEDASVGPISYEVVEPLKKVRARLEPNDAARLAFDLTFDGVLTPFFEHRNDMRDPLSGRMGSNVVRYHQGGLISGTIELEGETYRVTPDEWFGVRDHSWGIRGSLVGSPPPDLKPAPDYVQQVASAKTLMNWTQMFLRAPSGSYYELSIFLTGSSGIGDSAFLNYPDGRQELVGVESHMRYHPRTRFLESGEIHLKHRSGEKRVFEVEPVGESGFHLAAAGYGDWKGHRQGRYLGELVVDGEYIADCTTPEVLRSLGQFRDKPVRVREGSAEGYGIFESIITGTWPELGLDDSNHVPGMGI
ncbi:hypothetical protein [Amycolatopsis jejuensis]|uniref:hypothetical protein n=1 Tax=Amycolatopsis jejuensis TaxID=330084 RepID=UPI0005244313|nr:hypothetical protein [Amycolatopsis jejuensis]